MFQIKIISDAFNPWQLLDEYQRKTFAGKTNYGATASFVGTMRDFNENDTVSSLFLEHYPGMTEKQLTIIVEKLFDDFEIQHILLIHRVGHILPSESIVLIAVWSAHRAAAFSACHQLMERLKKQAPFWKKEKLTNGQYRWVEKNTDGNLAIPE